METRHGWLARNPAAPAVLANVVFDGSYPTRREEYGFLHDALKTLAERWDQLSALDAGCGYNPAIHVAPYIAGNLGLWVEAIDTDLAHLAMQFHPNIRRTFGSLAATPFQDGTFDVVYSISTLEHCPPLVQQRFIVEAFRLLKPGGYLLLTMDEIEPDVLAGMFAPLFDVGEERPFDPDDMLSPRVSYLIARKRG